MSWTQAQSKRHVVLQKTFVEKDSSRLAQNDSCLEPWFLRKLEKVQHSLDDLDVAAVVAHSIRFRRCHDLVHRSYRSLFARAVLAGQCQLQALRTVILLYAEIAGHVHVQDLARQSLDVWKRMQKSCQNVCVA